MNVLTLSLWPISSSAIGGTERFVLDFVEAMKPQGISSFITTISGKTSAVNATSCFSLDFGGGGKAVDEYALRRMFFKNFTEKRLMRFCARIENTLPQKRWDVFHATSLLFCGVFPETPKMFSLHTIPEEFEQIFGRGSFSRISSVIQRRTHKDTIFVAPARFSVPIFQRAFRRKVIFLPHAIDRRRFFAAESKKELLEEFGVPESFIVLNPARLEVTQKRQHLIIEALGQVRSFFPDLLVVFAGADTPYMNNIRTLGKLASKKGIPVSFFVLPPNDMVRMYQTANLVVLPSKYESFGYGALEALSLDINTVLSDIPPFREIAKGNPHAYIWKGSVPALARIIVKAGQGQNVSSTPREWHERYSIKTWGKRYADILAQFPR